MDSSVDQMLKKIPTWFQDSINYLKVTILAAAKARDFSDFEKIADI